MKYLIVLSLLLPTLLSASIGKGQIRCTTPRMGKELKISDTHITYIEDSIKNNEQVNGRKLASLELAFSNVRTRNTHKGFTKILSFEGHKHTIHIENKNSFNDVNDYLTIRSPQGHEIIYPLNCSRD